MRLTMAVVLALAMFCATAAAYSNIPVTILDESKVQSPVAITQATASLEDSDSGLSDYWFVTHVTLQNLGYKRVATVRIQWDLYGGGSYIEDVVEESPNTPVLMAGALRFVDWQRINTHSNVAEVEVGITEVRFEDGTNWTL